ncbi:MAG: GTPase HflX [Candidatus Nitrosopolaris sp.]
MSNSTTKVVLVTYPDSFRSDEAKILVESAGRTKTTMHAYQVIKTFTQKYLNHSKYGIGSGKAEEIKGFVSESKSDIILVDEHLTSKQIHNLEKLTAVTVIDRERLILDIFNSRATTTEAKLQIQLAEIKYQMPRVRENAKLTPGSGERAGKGGMGEYTVDVKFRDLKRQMSFIKEKLEGAKRKRHLYQEQRVKTGMPVVSLLGYTSSGKTTLFNLLTNEHKETSSSLFTTLSTTTRSLKLGDQDDAAALLTDTIGFISRLPAYMIDAFKSTLEESLAADLILVLIDCSEMETEDIRIKYSSCWDVLDELKVDKSKVFIILSKADSTHSERINEVANALDIPNPIVISSKTGYGIDKLKKMIASHVIKLVTSTPK